MFIEVLGQNSKGRVCVCGVCRGEDGLKKNAE